MRIFKEEVEYQGSPEEIARFFELQEPKDNITVEGFAGADFADFEATLLEATISESEMLRKKLAADPNYNPFPGVSPSPDSPVSAEHDTGVKFE